jgi:hypothetical protein
MQQQFEVPLAYLAWFQRFERILSVYHQDSISGADLEKLQLYLLDTGQFNASFTLEELERLDYPRSPFIFMHRHTYIRAADTWAMEVFRQMYQARNPHYKLFPIWIDSTLFWTELKRYCNVVEIDNTDRELANIVQRYFNDGNNLITAFWIKIDKPSKEQSEDDKKLIENKIKQQILRVVMNTKNVYPELALFFEALLTQQSFKNSPLTSHAEMLIALETLFPEIKSDHVKKINDLSPTDDLQTLDENWYKKIYGIAKKYKIELPENVKDATQLKQYTITNQQAFLTIVESIREAMRRERPSLGAYADRGRQWLSENIDHHVKKITDHFIYCFQDQFQGADAIVLYDCQSMPEAVNSVVSNIGYRIDPIRIIRLVLKQFPLLFVDSNQTEQFFNQFLTIARRLVNSLGGAEVENKAKLASELLVIDNLGKYIVGVINSKRYCVTKCLSFDQELSVLRKHLSKVAEPCKILGSYLHEYLTRYQTCKKTMVKKVVDAEIKYALNLFLQACQKNDLSHAIRYTQMIAEVMLLEFSFIQLSPQLAVIIKQQHLKNYPVQGVLLTPYAMRAFIRVFQIMDGLYAQQHCTITATNQSYFEWLQNLERLNSSKITVSRVQHISSISDKSDIIFAEVHPNNVVEAKQFSHDIRGLLSQIQQWPRKQRTLVVDATLNALDDEEIQSILQDASSLIQTGNLNIIFIQSLTKFLQIGLDKRSAGIIVVVNNGHHWATINNALKVLEQSEPVDLSTTNFFTYFVWHRALIKNYFDRINRNVRYVYNKILDKFNKLEASNKGRFQITMSSDPKACYIALNMNGLLPEIDQGFSFTNHDVEQFAVDVMKDLIHPLCQFYRLPLTERMSIGFPLCSVNIVFDSIRFTIGSETDSQLYYYAEILAYAAFVINRQHEPLLFFDKDANHQYSLRHLYFKEKVEQFMAMTPGINRKCIIEYDGTGSENSYYNHANQTTRQLKKRMEVINSKVIIAREVPINDGGNTHFLPYRITLPLRDVGHVSIEDPRVDLAMRRMSVACFSQYFRQGRGNYQNVNTTFDNYNRNVSLASMEILGSWNMKAVYGPFRFGEQKIFFRLHQMQITVFNNDRFYREDVVYVRQGHITLPLQDVPIEDREFLFREGHYERDRGARELASRGISVDMQYIPSFDDPTILTVENKKLIIQRDFICCNTSQATVYKRYLGRELTCFEIDYWIEKDPLLARLMRLLIAIYVRDKLSVSCSSQDRKLCRFLLNVSYDHKAVSGYFTEAIELISKAKHRLEDLLDRYQKEASAEQHQQNFLLFNKIHLNWQSGYSGLDHIGDEPLVAQGLTILKSCQQEKETRPLLNNSNYRPGLFDVHPAAAPVAKQASPATHASTTNDLLTMLKP